MQKAYKPKRKKEKQGGKMLNFYDSESTVKPNRIDTQSSQSGVYIRVCINEIEDNDGNVRYKYKEAFVDKAEWEQYIQIQNALGKKVTGANIEYTYKMNIPVLYPLNGFYYLPIWAEEIYADKLTKGQVVKNIFPMDIYDATNKKANAVSMTAEQLETLSEYLVENYQKVYFKEKKKIEELEN